MRRLGNNDYGYCAEVNGQKMEFATEKELDEYLEETSEESNVSSVF
jgi:hypothetical protein